MPDSHLRRFLRYEAGGMGHWFGPRGWPDIFFGVTPPPSVAASLSVTVEM
jgi:hypothetical protein